MAKTYVLREGDTLAQVAEQMLGDPKLAPTLADYNGLRDAESVITGQVVQIPTARELRSARAVPAGARAGGVATPWPPAPHGLPAIIETFGNIWDYARDDGTPDPKWETNFMARANLPFAIPLDWERR